MDHRVGTNTFATTWEELAELVFPSCESFMAAARRIAITESVTLTVTHKSRNTPGKTATQYRGCLVMNCVRFNDKDRAACKFEIKAWGPVEGGWRMRPIQHSSLPKHTVTSFCACNHPKEPIRLSPEPRSYDPVELLEIPFELPDDFINAATHMANMSQVNVYLLTLMVSDGQPKPNGRESTYIPRGFLTLECVEAENGCPYAIKAREESDGWYLRPWREKGKGDLKGAVSTLHCKHGQEVKDAYFAKLEEKASRPKGAPRAKKLKVAVNDTTLLNPDIAIGSVSGDHNHAVIALAQRAFGQQMQTGSLSNEQLFSSLDHSLALAAAAEAFDPYAAFNTSNNNHLVGNNGNNIASTSSHIFSHQQQQQQASHFPYNLPDGSDPTLTEQSVSRLPIPTAVALKRSGDPTTLASRAPKRIRNRSTVAGGVAGGLKTTWKRFLSSLDPHGRLNTVNAGVLSEGGVDPGAVVSWPSDQITEFVEAVAKDVAPGIKIHLRVMLLADGKRVWQEMLDRK